MRPQVVTGALVLLLVLHGCSAEPVDEPAVTQDEPPEEEVEDPEEPEQEAPDRYEISNVRIKKEDPLVGNVPTYYIVFDAKWLGDGTPPLVTCSYTVFAEDGSKIEKGNTRLAVDEGTALESTVEKEGIVPASAKFDQCPPNGN